MTAPAPATWAEVLASALVGTARSGGVAGAVLDTVAALALRRRAGVALLDGERPEPAPVDDVPTVGPSASARADALLALDNATRGALPVKDMAARLELLAEWLAAVRAAGRRVPPELVPALLEAARRHRDLRPSVAAAGGPLAAWLAAQRPEWGFATDAPPAPPTDADEQVWEFGSAPARAAFLRHLRRHDPRRAYALLDAAWQSEAPDDRVTLLPGLAVALTGDDEPLLERALDDRRKQVRAVALDLLAALPDSAYARRMTARARACLVLTSPSPVPPAGGGPDRAVDSQPSPAGPADAGAGPVDPAGSGGAGTAGPADGGVPPVGAVDVRPPAECDREMRRDGIAPRPPAGTGERAWWLEEVLARAPLSTWPADLLDRRMPEQWVPTVRRGLARAAATQRDPVWAAALVDGLADDAVTHGRLGDRLLVEALYDALPADDLTERAATALRRGLAEATAAGVDHVLALLPRPWPPGVADAVFAAIEGQFLRRGGGWRVAALCELAALRLPADLAPRAAALVERHREVLPTDPRGAAVGRFASVLRFRHEMIQELT